MYMNHLIASFRKSHEIVAKKNNRQSKLKPTSNTQLSSYKSIYLFVFKMPQNKTDNQRFFSLVKCLFDHYASTPIKTSKSSNMDYNYNWCDVHVVVTSYPIYACFNFNFRNPQFSTCSAKKLQEQELSSTPQKFIFCLFF